MSNITHIGVFGRRNTGKSSLINAVTGQEIAIVSDTPGTTTDPVKKRIEIPGLGLATLIDTAGIDDSGELGAKRVYKSLDTIQHIDFALLLITNNKLDEPEEQVIAEFKKAKLKYIIVHSQSDIVSLKPEFAAELSKKHGIPVVEYSSAHLEEEAQRLDTERLIECIIDTFHANRDDKPSGLFDGLISKDNIVVLVCPIDSEVPASRLILPQVNAIREILDREAIVVTLQPDSLSRYIKENQSLIKIVVTDSQAFGYVSYTVPQHIPLTSFSILLARSKGNFHDYLKGAKQIDSLADGDKVLILESCTHHSTCDDIGRVKIPKLLMKYTGKKLEFVFVSGLDRLPEPIDSFSLAIQCGGCMVTERQLANRVNKIIYLGISVTNYGMAIAYCNNIFDRATLFLQ